MDITAPVAKRFLFFQAILVLSCGIVVSIFSLNGVLRYLAQGWAGTTSGNALLGLAAIPDNLYGRLPGERFFWLELLFRWVMLSLTVFVSLLLLNSLRHQTVNIFVSGVGGLLLGVFALTWISLFVFLVGGVLYAVAWVYSFLHWIIAGILAFLLWTPVLVTVIGLVVLAAAIPLLGFLKDLSREQILAWIKELFSTLSIRLFLVISGIVATVAFVWLVVVPLWREYISPILALISAWLIDNVLPILAFLFSGLTTIVLILLALVAITAVLAILGRQLIDQLTSAHLCGRDLHKAFAAGFTVGAAAGLSLLVCSANDEYRAVINGAWAATSLILIDLDIVRATYALMPGSAETLLQGLFTKASPPIFDLAMLVVTLFLANCSLLMGLLSGITVEPLRQLFTRERMPLLARVLFGIVVGVTIAAVDSIANQD